MLGSVSVSLGTVYSRLHPCITAVCVKKPMFHDHITPSIHGSCSSCVALVLTASPSRLCRLTSRYAFATLVALWACLSCQLLNLFRPAMLF